MIFKRKNDEQKTGYYRQIIKNNTYRLLSENSLQTRQYKLFLQIFITELIANN